jgi:hypothetical protein
LLTIGWKSYKGQLRKQEVPESLCPETVPARGGRVKTYGSLT